MAKIALITGATAGIGQAIAKKLAKAGFNLIITGRRVERLNLLAAELKKEWGIDVLSLDFDVRVYADVHEKLSKLPTQWKDVDVLVNNAGLAVGLAPIHEGLIEDWERMIDTNIKGLLYVTRTISPHMVARKSGHIINIASIAGKETYSNGNVYCATKHAVDSLSKAMRIDMVSYGIRVTQICPGAVDTEFSTVRFKGDKARADSVYNGFTPLFAEDIANAVSYAVMAPSHVDIQDMLVMPTAQAAATIIHKK